MKKLLALVLTLCLALGVSLASAETFKMGIDPEYDPFSYMGNDGDYTGLNEVIRFTTGTNTGIRQILI